MTNLSDKYCFKPSANLQFLENSIELTTTNKRELFSDRSKESDASFAENKTNRSNYPGMLPRNSSVNTQMNQFFKIPNFENLPVKKATVRSVKCPRLQVQTGRVKNDLKQQSKMSLIPRPSFINSRKSLKNGTRSNQLNARKELLKKMVFLAECSLKENKEIKQTTPVKVLASLTPKKTPRSGGYFILPEFNKKIPKLEEIRSPIDEFVKREVFANSANHPPVILKKYEIPAIKTEEEFSFIKTLKDEVTPVKNALDKRKSFMIILSHCNIFNEEVKMIHEKIRLLDNSFKEKLKDIPDYRVYNEFCIYQTKKEELYKQLQTLEVNLRNFISSNTKVGVQLETYMNEKQELLEKQTNLHKDFEQALKSILEKLENGKVNEEKVEEKNQSKVETPKLRRSLRLSKIKKSKFEERTPMTRKLKKLDSKSKGIQKSGKVRSP